MSQPIWIITRYIVIHFSYVCGHSWRRSWQVWKSRDVTKANDAGLHKQTSHHLPPWLHSSGNQPAALHHMHKTASSATPNTLSQSYHTCTTWSAGHCKQTKVEHTYLCIWQSKAQSAACPICQTASGSAAVHCRTAHLHKPTFQFQHLVSY